MSDVPAGTSTVLVLTPVKQAAAHLDRYFELLARLSFPAGQLSIGLLEGDSTDGTYEQIGRRLEPLRERRVVLARARNRLLHAALQNEQWVLWLDVDVIDYPADVIEQLLASGKDIVTPHCVTRPGGPSFDWNAWRENGQVRLDQLRGQELVRLDGVGGTMLLVRADLHREGLVFPAFLYGRASPFARDPSPYDALGVGEVETEGLALMAKDMGYECWGMPGLEIVHPNE
jgi:glycosyltransferase involved in cell wall biosynthesis